MSTATAPAPASLQEALAMLRAAQRYLAALDPTGLTTAEQAGCLIEMEQDDAIGTAARAWMLGAFTAGQGPAADADCSARSWLMRKTGVTKGCAAGHVGWARRVQAHPLVAAELARGGRLSAPLGKVICDYTDKLPMADRDKADAILAGVAVAGARQDDIARLAAQMWEKSRSGLPDEDPDSPDSPGSPGDPGASGDDPDSPDDRGGSDEDADGTHHPGDSDDGAGNPGGPGGGADDPGYPGYPGYPWDPDDRFDDRLVRLDTTLGGAGVLYGDLSPDCTALVTTVLDALSAPAGAEDTRSKAQRWHDGLAEAMRRLLAAGLLPDRSGAATRALVHIALAELRALPGASKLEAVWVARAQQDWAGHRAAGPLAGGGDGGAAARGAYCDALVVPVVTGQANPTVLDRLVGLCVQLAGHGHRQPAAPQDEPGTGKPAPGTPWSAAPAPGPGGGPLTAHAREMLQRAIIGAAVELVAGPGGLASALRTGLLRSRLAGPSLPLDVGSSATVPPAIRQAVTLRADGHCEWPGGCDQPAPACHVHHVIRKADGGRTSVNSCLLLCSFHHLTAVHRWGWQLILNPDGTTTARSPDGTKVLRSHGPPPRPG